MWIFLTKILHSYLNNDLVAAFILQNNGWGVVVSLRRREIPALTEGGKEYVAEENAYLELVDPDEGTAMVRQSEEEVVTEQSKKVKKRRLQKPAGSRLPDREQLVIPSVAPPSQESEGFLDSSARTNLQICTTVESSSALVIPVDTTTAATTSTRAAATTRLATDVYPDLAVDRAAPPAFFSALRSMDYDQIYTEFNVGAAQQVCLEAEVRSRAEHELELKEKLRVKYNNDSNIDKVFKF
ncbi:hypothetical protein Tco_0918615 [Tanacetum coccineum]